MKAVRASPFTWILFAITAGLATTILAASPRAPVATPAAAPVDWVSPARAETDSCIDCHGDPDLRVTNKRLYEYFDRWRLSTHAQAGVRCVDCHGGDPTGADKETAHGPRDGGALDFRAVPQTCGSCHADAYESYVGSRHFALLEGDDRARQGPNCVTCHGSLDALALTPATVDAVCGHCHAEDPVIGQQAERLLRDLETIQAYGRFVRLRGHPETVASADRVLLPVHRNLIREWHGFDLDAIEARTADLLDLSRLYRDRVRSERRPAVSPSEAPGLQGGAQ